MIDCKMGVKQIYRKLIFLAFLFVYVNGQISGPSFLVTFPSVIQSGSSAKFCASLLKPSGGIVMNVYLVNNEERTLLLQVKPQGEFHRCFDFKAPQLEVESVQKIKVEVVQQSSTIVEERKVMFRPYYNLTFIQTDKPIYTPGQTVRFRVITTDLTYRPLNQWYDMVVVEDDQENRINQWLNVSPTNWIVELSHELNPDARLGMYKLKAYIGERIIMSDFQVKKYVLPKFDVTVMAAQTHSVGEEQLKVVVCGQYTYGQPVPGKAWVGVCRDRFDYVSDVIRLCLNTTVQMNKTGCAALTFNTSAFVNFTFENYLQDSLVINASVTEEGTDTVMTKSETISLTYEIGKVLFTNLPDLFKSGSIIQGKMKATHFNGTPVYNKVVYLLEGYSWAPKLLQNLTTDRNGVASFSLNTASLPNSDLNLMASVTPDARNDWKTPYFTTDERTVRLIQTATSNAPTLSELTVEKIEQPLKCNAEFTINIKYYFVGETGTFTTAIVFMVLSRGVIVQHGFKKVDVITSDGAAGGTVSFKLPVGVDFTPVVQILTYCVLPSDNVVAGSINLDVEKCFKNEVSVQFSPASAVPAEENTIQLSAQPNSLCAVSVVDQSVLILEPGKRLDADKLFNLLPVQSLSDYPYGVEDEQECLFVRSRRAVAIDGAYEALKTVGLKMVTNLPVRAPQCLTYRGLSYYRNFYDERYYRREPGVVAMAAPLVAGLGDATSPDVTVRTAFPETWVWQVAAVGDSGSAQVPVKVPDTITTWESEVFCLSSKGLGLAPPARLTVFQPFFLELSLPYSIIRGERFVLKATVFNYLSKCIVVNVTPTRSLNFTLVPLPGSLYSSCLCAKERETFSWTFTPLVLGDTNVTISAESRVTCGTAMDPMQNRLIDTVTRSLRVLAEGVERVETYSWLLCPKEKTTLAEVTLALPPNVVKGSSRWSVSVLGDVMGRALKNLAELLQMPYGCGEQNIAVLSPNIYILQYLENTEQLTSDIRERATGYLKSGYQRQLHYRHSDGAYSTFGSGDGNTWLTAFVLRSFGKAQKYTFIDPDVIKSAKDWLISKQGQDGCFMQQGRLFNNAMKGGVKDDVTTTAYITASFLELNTDPEVTQALSCLKSVIGKFKNTYTTALLAYTFSLARDADTRQKLLKALDAVSISSGGLLHWSPMGSAAVSGSLAVEISSYVLLALLTADSVTEADLGKANRIVNWLVRQQNAYGGFSSTQDTVVALQALSLYATKVFSSAGSTTVKVQSAGDSLSFAVKQDNKLLYQEKQLKNDPGKCTIEATGSTCVSVQVALFYNIPRPVQAANTLVVEAKLTGECLLSSGPKLTMNLTIISKESPNMVTVDIKVLSGFKADSSTLVTPANVTMERLDEDDQVTVYLDGVEKNVLTSCTLQMKRVYPVKSLQPAVIEVYDYYQPSVKSEIMYSSPCA